MITNNKEQVAIKINNGNIIFCQKPKIKSTKCKWCGKKIYCIKTNFGKTLLASKLPCGEFISHFLVCEKLKKINKNNL